MIPNIPGAVSSLASTAASAGNAAASASQAGSSAGSFSEMLHAGVQQATAMESNAHSAVMGLLSGEGVEVHGAMVATQQAELAFELALQVRNKAVSAYQQMMQMQF